MRLGLTAAYAAIVLLLGSLIFATAASAAQSGPKAAPTATIAVQQLPPISSPQDNFDPLKATNAYLAQVSGEARARSDSYFEGGYILLFVNAFYAVLVSAILLWLHISARIRNIARGITRSRFWQVPIYVLLYMPLATAMAFPLTVYENYLREHAYGLSNQTFVQWLGDFGKDFALTIVILTVGLTVIYAVIRAARRTWWIWGTLVAVGFLAFGTLVGPVFIAPLFNHYQPLQEGPLKARILSLARAEGIPARNVYEFDASRQTNRISANVSGLFGTTRISLNDNLINRCTPDEVIAVFGHEMGHYVLNHAAILITWFGLLLLVGFAFVDWGFRRPGERVRRKLGRPHDRRSSGIAGDHGAPQRLHARGDADLQYHHAHNRSAGRYLRRQRGAPAGRLRQGGVDAERIPQARPDPARGISVLRPSVRPLAHRHDDALEGRTSERL